jgi:hypothetical protein
MKAAREGQQGQQHLIHGQTRASGRQAEGETQFVAVDPLVRVLVEMIRHAEKTATSIKLDIRRPELVDPLSRQEADE